MDRQVMTHRIERILLVICFLSLAYLSSQYKIEIFYGAYLSLSALFIVLLRPVLGTLKGSLLLILLYLYFILTKGYDAGYALFFLELLLIFQLTRFKRLKTSYTFIVILFWGLVIPIFAIFNLLETAMLFDEQAFILYVILFMGSIVNALVAEVLVVYLPFLSQKTMDYYRVKLMDLVYHFFMVGTVIPLVVYSFLSFNHFGQVVNEQVKEDLSERIALFNTETSLWNQDHIYRIMLGETTSIHGLEQFLLAKQGGQYLYYLQLEDGRIMPQSLYLDADSQYGVRTIENNFYLIYPNDIKGPHKTYMAYANGYNAMVSETVFGRILVAKSNLLDRNRLFAAYFKYLSVLAVGVLGALILLFFAFKWISKNYEHILNLTTDLPNKIETHEAIKWPETRFYELNRFVQNTKIMAGEILFLFDESEKLNLELESQTDALLQSEEDMRELALTDGLTGLPNRYAFNQYLERMLVPYDQDSLLPPMAVIFMDLDRFKAVNDTYGHSIGDLLLQQVTKRILDEMGETTSDHHLVARLGGDEFVIVMQYEAFDALDSQLKALLKNLNHPYQLETYELYSVASFGVALCPKHGIDKEILLKKADSAMYHAKALGGNCYRVYDDYMVMDARDQIIMEKDIHEAIHKNAFQLQYQPIMALESDCIIGVEALVRWHHPQKGLLMPEAFLSTVDAIGMLLPLVESTLKTVQQDLKNWQAVGILPKQITINLSRQQIIHPDIQERLYALNQVLMPIQSLILEIHASTLMHLEPEVQMAIRGLAQKELIIGVVDVSHIDAFKNILEQPSLKQVKLSMNFIKRVYEVSEDDLKTTIKACQKKDLKVFALGVETDEDLALCHSCGIDGYQGFIVSPSMAPKAFIQFCKVGDQRWE